MGQGRQAFLNELQGLSKKYDVNSYFFYGIDSEGRFGDTDISNKEAVTMILAILDNERYADAADSIAGILAEGFRERASRSEGTRQEQFKWTWRKE
jgi:hypothetical protein